MASSSVHQQVPADDTDLPLTIEQQEAIITEDPSRIIDDLGDEMDDDFDLGGFRERRMEEMRSQLSHP